MELEERGGHLRRSSMRSFVRTALAAMLVISTGAGPAAAQVVPDPEMAPAPTEQPPPPPPMPPPPPLRLVVPQARPAAPTEPTVWNAVHFNPVQIAYGVYGLGYERVLHRNLSLHLEAEFTHQKSSDLTSNGYGAAIQPHVYLLRPAPGGLYLAPFVRLAYATVSGDDVEGHGTAWSAGATVGWSWVFGLFNIKAGLGIQYLSMDVGASASSGESLTVGLKGWWPAGDIKLGVVF
jgi:hypothetical protein